MTVRRTLLWVVALVASFVISATTAVAAEEAGVGEPAPGASAASAPPAGPPASAEPAPAEAVPTEPAATEPAPDKAAPDEAAPAEAAPAEAGPAEPVPPNAAATEPAASDPAPAQPARSASPADPTPPAGTPSSATATPREEAGAEPGRAPQPAGEADKGPAALDEPAALEEPEPQAETQEVVAVARNRSLVFQVVWQVQEGCRSHCYGTSQSQSAVQWSSTKQTASAVAGSGEMSTAQAASGAAEAHNESVTVQFVWQLQIGCVAFCYETSQTQVASQWAQTIQTALAEGDLEAWAENLSRTLQYVWQMQEGCDYECYGVIQSQTISQGQSTTQSATATAGDDTPVTMLVLGPDGALVLPGWLVALAENQGATIQTIYQYQEALCRENCEGDVQLQEAIQEALTTQQAIAVAWVGPPPAEDPPAEQPPATAPSAGQPSSAQPPVEPPSAAQRPVEQDQSPSATLSASREPAKLQTLSSELPPRREIRRIRTLLSHGSDPTGAPSGDETRSIAPAVRFTGGGAAPPPPAVAYDVPAASMANTGMRTEATASQAKRDVLLPFGFGLALEPVSVVEPGGWDIVALPAAALALLASVGLVARRRVRPGI